MAALTAGEALMHVLQPVASGSCNVLVLATGDGNLEGQAPNTVAGRSAWYQQEMAMETG